MHTRSDAQKSMHNKRRILKRCCGGGANEKLNRLFTRGMSCPNIIDAAIFSNSDIRFESDIREYEQNGS